MKFGFLYLIMSLVFLSNSRSQSLCSMDLLYSGDQTSHIPILVFYLHGTENKLYDEAYIKKFEISNRMRFKMEKILERIVNLPDEDTLLSSAYEFKFNCGSDSNVISVLSLAKIRKIFSEFQSLFKDSPNSKSINESLREILAVIKYEYQRG